LLSATLGVLLPALAGCGIQASGITALGPAPAAAGASAAPSFDAASSSDQYVLFFYLGDRLTADYRTAKDVPSETSVLDALLAGPDAAEMAKGYATMLPAKLSASPRASGLLYAYALNQPLSVRAKAQFVCTMQYYDQTISVGIQVLQSNVNWNACSDTTSEYIPMPGAQSSVPTVSTLKGG
jgi:hypothetical protein